MGRRRSFQTLVLLLSALVPTATTAAPIDLVLIGTWSTSPGSGHTASGTEVATGGKFVIKTTYDPDVTPIMATNVNGFDYFTVDLAGGTAPPSGGGLVSNGNTLDVLVPLEGFDTAMPFIYSLDELDHGDFSGDPFPSVVPQIHFRDAAGTDFLGFKLEAFDFGPGGNFLHMATEIANIDPGDGIPVPTPSTVVNLTTDTFATVIRSINSIADSAPVAAEAGDPLAFSAGALTITTDGGTVRNLDGTWQDNDLGAARSDQEDFLTHDWELVGSVQGGAAGTALVGADATAERPNIIVDLPPSGTRTVENVNKIVDIVNSGLQSTTDVATWQVSVTEDLTGFDGGSDTVEVSYQNAGPTALVGPDLVYSAGATAQLPQGGVNDADLAVNAIISGFESHSFDWTQGGASLPGSPSASPDLLVDIVDSGLTTTLDTVNLALEVTDLAGASDSIVLGASYANALPSIDVAIATPVANDILFELSVGDLDLGINALGLVDFELIQVEYLLDGGAFFGLADLLANGMELVDIATLLSQFGGLGMHTLEVRATDRFLRDQGTFENAFIDFTVVPEPGTGILVSMGLIGLAARLRRTRGDRQ